MLVIKVAFIYIFLYIFYESTEGSPGSSTEEVQAMSVPWNTCGYNTATKFINIEKVKQKTN